MLRDVSFRLAAGRVLGVLGRTGSGKTTLTRLLFRLYDPTGGAGSAGGCRYTRRSRAGRPARARGHGDPGCATFQRQPPRQHRLFRPRAIGDARIIAALDALGLRGLAGRPCRRASTRHAAPAGGGNVGGRSAIARLCPRLLLKDPGLIILDEAASRLDPITERRPGARHHRLLNADRAPAASSSPIACGRSARRRYPDPRRGAVVRVWSPRKAAGRPQFPFLSPAANRV